MRISLFTRIFVVLWFLTIVSLLLLWMVLRPRQEAAAAAGREAALRTLQNFAVENFDRAFETWSGVSQFVITQVTDRPKEGEAVLRTMMTLHPEIVQIRIRSLRLPDELVSQNTLYRTTDIAPSDTAWITSKTDTAFRMLWMTGAEIPYQLVAMQAQFRMQGMPFLLTIEWDASALKNSLAAIPFDTSSSVTVQTESAVLCRAGGAAAAGGFVPFRDTTAAVQTVRAGNTIRRIFARPLRTFPLWVAAGLPEYIPDKNADEVFTCSSLTIASLSVVASILLWFSLRRRTPPPAEKPAEPESVPQ